jgi:tol-pal system protein YbgF
MRLRRVSDLPPALVCGALLCGCAHAPPPAAPATSQIEELQRRLTESQTREADLQRQLDEANNRLFILQDQAEAREIAARRKAPPRLPVDSQADSPSDAQIEYSGAARDTYAPRPVLKLTGSGAPNIETVSAIPPENGPHAAAPRPSSSAPVRANKPAVADSGVSDDDRLPVTRFVPKVPPKGTEVASALTGPPDHYTGQGSGPAAPRETPAPAVAPGAKVAAHAAPASSSSAVDAMKLYGASVELLKQGQHAEAIAGLHKFLQAYPSHDYADNAQYWLGECYYDQKDFKTALREFRRVVQHYPSGNKAPDALLKVGFCYVALQEGGKARDVLEQVVKSYPGTEVARKATEKLELIK